MSFCRIYSLVEFQSIKTIACSKLRHIRNVRHAFCIYAKFDLFKIVPVEYSRSSGQIKCRAFSHFKRK